MRKIGFIGVGNIGAPMARRLIGHGFELVVCDASPATLDRFAADAIVTARPSDCAAADLVIVMVAHDAQLAAVMFGADGLAAAIDPSRPPLVAIMSTVLPETVRDVAARLVPAGATVVDAPVSGGAVRAAKGTLAIMVGGDDVSFARLRPVLEVMGTAIHHCGGLGSGEITKIINNLVGVTNLFLFAEAMQIAARYDLDLGRLAAIMETGSGRNNGTRDWSERQALYRYNAESPEVLRAVVDVTRKDLRHAEALAARTGLLTPLLGAVTRAHRETPYEQILERWREVSGEEASA